MISLLQNLQFGTPLALIGLLSLPIIWWLLRFTPPRPRQIKFPPLRILLNLPNQEETPDKTPWWMLLLRLALAAFLIFAVAQPFLQPKGLSQLPSGHRLIVVDNGWAAAGQWSRRHEHFLGLLEQARDAGLPVSIAVTAPSLEPLPVVEGAAREAIDKARLLKPSPLSTDRLTLLKQLREAKLRDIRSVVWLADGIGPEQATTFAAGLQQIAPGAPLIVHSPEARDMPLALGPITIDGNEIKLPVLSTPNGAASAATISVRATNGRTLLDVPVTLAAGGTTPASFILPSALRNEIQSIALEGQDHAGARQLFDDRWRRRSIALQANTTAEQSQPLLSPLHYLRRGLEPFAELFEPANDTELQSLIDGGLSMLVMSDIGTLEQDKERLLGQWVERGGIIVRFAGPRLAAGGDSLLPVRLREGDRSLGSALSWDVPQGLAPFPETSPFAGLVPDPSVRVARQILAEPDVEIASRNWANLEDGTPLVTAEKRGKGLIVLFHVTSNANWSNLPLSGLFLEMLQRVAGLDPSAATVAASSSDTDFVPRLVLNGSGDLVSADGSTQPIATKDFDKATASLLHPPGLYAKQGREHALNLALQDSDLQPMPANLPGANMRGYEAEPRQDLAPYLFALAALLFLADTFATLLIGGGLSRKSAAAAMILVALLLPVEPLLDGKAYGQTAPPSASEMEIAAALQTRLAYVETGDSDIDRTSAQGLLGLTYYLTERTSTTLADPHAINIERDDITFYPLLYWPLRESTERLSAAARAKLLAYMRNGGMVFFDTRDGGLDLDGGGNSSLRTLLEGLELPPLEPVPDQHVLTRSFYLLDRFPGRFEGPRPWVESSIGENTSDPGTADGVSSVIVGSNDYAAAWAIDDSGTPLYAVVPGNDRQREFAMRVGINAVMYALTGNYKADQVHVPAFLERLGQ
jgi:hypothetical protein